MPIHLAVLLLLFLSACIITTHIPSCEGLSIEPVCGCNNSTHSDNCVPVACYSYPLSDNEWQELLRRRQPALLVGAPAGHVWTQNLVGEGGGGATDALWEQLAQRMTGTPVYAQASDAASSHTEGGAAAWPPGVFMYRDADVDGLLEDDEQQLDAAKVVNMDGGDFMRTVCSQQEQAQPKAKKRLLYLTESLHEVLPQLSSAFHPTAWMRVQDKRAAPGKLSLRHEEWFYERRSDPDQRFADAAVRVASDGGFEVEEAAEGGSSFSLSLWAGSQGVVTQAHVDAPHNVFAQVAGHKRFTLWHPSLARHLRLFPHLHPRARKSQVRQPLLGNDDDEGGVALQVPPQQHHRPA